MKIQSWNVHGLNPWKKRTIVKRLIQQHNPSIVLLQETKLPDTDSFLVKSIGSFAIIGWSEIDAIDTSDGLILRSAPDFTVHDVIQGLYIVSIQVSMASLSGFQPYMFYTIVCITLIFGRSLMTWLVWEGILGLLGATLT